MITAVDVAVNATDPPQPLPLRSVTWIGPSEVEAVVDIARRSQSSIRQIEIRLMQFIDLEIEFFNEYLLQVAPQLETLSLSDITYMTPLVEARLPFDAMVHTLNNLRHLHLQIDSIDPTTVFDSLAKLPRLETFRLSDSPNILTSNEVAPLFKISSLERVLLEGPASPCLRLVKLSRAIQREWCGEERNRAQALVSLRAVGKKVGVKIKFG